MLLQAKIGVGLSSIRLVTVSLFPRISTLYSLICPQIIPTLTKVCFIPSFESDERLFRRLFSRHRVGVLMHNQLRILKRD
jgi:hypothetical protein